MMNSKWTRILVVGLALTAGPVALLASEEVGGYSADQIDAVSSTCLENVGNEAFCSCMLDAMLSELPAEFVELSELGFEIAAHTNDDDLERTNVLILECRDTHVDLDAHHRRQAEEAAAEEAAD